MDKATAEKLAAKIISTANAGYHGRDDYPPFAAAPWDDRPRWSAYIMKVAVEVLAAEST